MEWLTSIADGQEVPRVQWLVVVYPYPPTVMGKRNPSVVAWAKKMWFLANVLAKFGALQAMLFLVPHQ